MPKFKFLKMKSYLLEEDAQSKTMTVTERCFDLVSQNVYFPNSMTVLRLLFKSDVEMILALRFVSGPDK